VQAKEELAESRNIMCFVPCLEREGGCSWAMQQMSMIFSNDSLNIVKYIQAKRYYGWVVIVELR